jgi:hypothetical protein
MAGTIVADTLQNGAGTSTSMTNAITGSAKAWVYIAGGTSPVPYANASFNVSSITYNAGGDYQVNFTTALPYANYAANATNAGSSTQPVYARPNNASSCRVVVNGGSNYDVGFSVFSN